jgi:hypothetical protein
MRRLLLAIVFLGMACIASAECPSPTEPVCLGDIANKLNVGGILQKIPELNAGMAYSLIDNKWNALSTFDILSTKNKMFTLSGGWAGVAEETGNKAVLVASVDIFSLKNVDWPILKYLSFRPGIYAGFGSINLHRIMESELDWGVSATLVSYKF